MVPSALTKDQKDQVVRFIRNLTTHRFTFRDIVRMLDLDSDDRRSLQRFLDELDSEGTIRRVKRGQYAVAARENLVSGTLSCHRDGYGFLLPDDRAQYREDIFIPARNMGDALHEDRVLVRVAPRQPIRTRSRRQGGREDGTRSRLEGVVVRVLERKRSILVGRYRAHIRYPYVEPLDSRILCDIRIPYHAARGAREGQIVAVEMTLPPGRNQIPQGRITEILGYPGDPGIEYRIVEHKFGLPVNFSPEALREADALPDCVLEEDFSGREDLRGEIAVTIDGETARDFDDAISLKRLPSGNYLLGVHIADVSRYVPEDSALDADAFERGTSVYFPDRAIPMLPPKLSSGICSLQPDADRLVLSALMEIDAKGKIVGKRFFEGILRSRARLTYTSVARILVDRDPRERERYAPLVPLLETMEELCRLLSQNRYRRGAVDFDLPEADIQFSESGKILRVVPAERNIAHRIVEEFMIVANECVAEKLASSGGPALYRVHEKPDPDKVDEFAEFVAALGYRLEKHNGEYRPRDFQKFIAQLEGKNEQRFLTYLMLRSFMQAHYSERNIGHFGLASSVYTHFTSPIRRYPDLVVHRLLKECLQKEPSEAWRERMSGRLPEVALHTSSRERVADEAEREIERIKKAQFMADKVGDIFDAVVLSVSRQGFFVELPDPYVEGFVPVETLPRDLYTYQERTRSIVGKRGGRRYHPGTKTRVRLDRVDRETARLYFSVAVE